MAADQEIGNVPLRSITYDKIIKGFADRAYKFKQAVSINSSNAWTNFFYRESPAVLSGGTSNAVAGVPRGAQFPHAVQQYDKIRSTITKFGLEQSISWEDVLANDINAVERALFKIAEGTAKAVDDAIWDVLTESRAAPANIISYQIYFGAQSTQGAWNETSSAFANDLLAGKRLLAENNYPVDKLMLFLSPRDYQSVARYIIDKGAQWNKTAENVMDGSSLNGYNGTIMGVDLIVSNSVTASYALLVVPKRCANWRQLVPLQTSVKEDPFVSTTVRAVEEGVCELTDPKSVVMFVGTQKV